MRVRSADVRNADASLSLDARRYPGRDEHDLVIGQEYLVLGISVVNGSVLAELAAEGGFLVPVPMSALQIVSGSPSKYWDARMGDDRVFRLWPVSFYRPFYHSDLADRVPEVVTDFQEVCRRLEVEDRRNGLASV